MTQALDEAIVDAQRNAVLVRRLRRQIEGLTCEQVLDAGWPRVNPLDEEVNR